MTFTNYKKAFSLLLLLLVFLTQPAKAVETEIRYRITGVEEVYLIWGVNDWQRYEKKLPATIIGGETMRTTMVKEGDEYVARLDIEPGYVIDYGFMFVKKTGPFGVKVQYWDMDDHEGKKEYFVQSGSDKVVKLVADVNKIPYKGVVSLNNYALLLFTVFGLSALCIFFARKYYYKKPGAPFSQAGYFMSLTGALACILFFIRAYIAGLLYAFLLQPLQSFAGMFAAARDDMKYVAILFVFFGLLFLFFKKIRKTILVTYSVAAFFSVIAALANIRIMTLLGRPFNYQWLYYSGFLKSTDASLAMTANVDRPFITGSILLLFSIVVIFWLLYQVYLRKKLPVILLLPLLFVICLLAQTSSNVPFLKAANPVLFFMQSAYNTNTSVSIDKSFAGKSDFDIKNRDSLPAYYAGLFHQPKIKNVIFVVLESTPWEYVGPYTNKIKATPFLDAYKNKAVFENIYAHIPSTNKSMFSFLCSSYPEISFKSLTVENPGIILPSIPSELKKYGYRSAFFNSGDNDYQNAGVFLKNRGFDTVADFHNNPCSSQVFSDKRYSKNKLDGVDDSCLSARLFNWLGTDTTTPFFTMMWTFQTHYPYFIAGTEKKYGTGNPSLEKYLNGLSRADETIQHIVQGLEQRGLLESTLLVVSGDHGEAFGRHGQTTHAGAVYEENIHVPFMLMNPLLFKGERIPVIGGISDIAPTIFSVLNKPAPELWQGESLFSVNRRRRIYFFNPYADYLFGMREGDLKLIFNATDNRYQLFNLAKDPHETNDIATEHEDFVKEGSKNLYAWMYYQQEYMNNVLNAGTGKGNK